MGAGRSLLRDSKLEAGRCRRLTRWGKFLHLSELTFDFKLVVFHLHAVKHIRWSLSHHYLGIWKTKQLGVWLGVHGMLNIELSFNTDFDQPHDR